MQKAEIENEIDRLTKLVNCVPRRFGTPILKKIAALTKRLEQIKDNKSA